MRIAKWLPPATLASLGLVLFLPEGVLAWGGQGHRVVARLAMEEIRRQAASDPDARRARDMVFEAIEVDADATVESASVFPDLVRGNAPYAYADDWHFVSIPRSETSYDAARHCPTNATAPEGNCAVGGLAHFRKVVLEQQGSANKMTLDALSFIIHIVGDLHQPMHASEDRSFVHNGRPGDRGGNYRRVCFLGTSQSACTEVWNGERKPKNLHATWDKYIIVRSGRASDETEYVEKLAERISNLDDATRADYLAGGPAEWAEESHALAVEAAYTPPLLRDTTIPHPHRYDNYFFVDAAYQDANIERVETQLVKASVRLAAYLKQIARELE